MEVSHHELRAVARLIDVLNTDFNPSGDSSIAVDAVVTDSNGEKIGTVRYISTWSCHGLVIGDE